MHRTYKQDLYKNKDKEIDYLFLEYLVPVMDDILPSCVNRIMDKNLDTAAYEKNLHKDVKLQSINNKIDFNDKT